MERMRNSNRLLNGSGVWILLDSSIKEMRKGGPLILIAKNPSWKFGMDYCTSNDFATI